MDNLKQSYPARAGKVQQNTSPVLDWQGNPVKPYPIVKCLGVDPDTQALSFITLDPVTRQPISEREECNSSSSTHTHTHTPQTVGGVCDGEAVDPLLSKGTNFTAKEKTITYAEPYHPTDARHVVDIAIGSQDIIVKCLTRGGTQSQTGGGVRKEITEWSAKSRRACELHIRNLPEGSVKCFLTLTYPESFPVDGKLSKKHLDNMKKWLTRRGIAGVWFLEFQRRGAPHYHAFLSDWVPGGADAVAVAWDRIVSSGDEKHIAWHRGELSGRPCLEWMRKPHAASWYASKYAVKAEQKQVPENYLNVGRFWGHWGGMRPVWNYIFGHGYTVFCDALHSILNFRLERGIAKPMTVDTRYSSVLRGAMTEGFDYWFPDWVPF